MAAKSLPDGDATLTRYKAAFRMCYGRMPRVLVMEDIISYLVEKGQLRSDLQSRIQAKETNAKQVQCLLDDIRGGLEAGYPERFDVLMIGIKEYAIRENLNELKQLCDDIQILRGTAPKPVVDSHVSSLRKKFKELNIEVHTHAVGVALLVSNDYATLGAIEELSFTHKDADSMEQLFMEFGYIVYRKKNVSSGEFISYHKKLAEYQYPPTCRRFLVYFSGHGDSEYGLLMHDGCIVEMDQIVEFFDPKIASNEMLIEMAKIFLIDTYSLKVKKLDDCPLASAKPQGRITCPQRIPKVFNVLVAYACTQCHSASQVTVGRNWSDCLIKALRESTERDGICGILTRAKQLITELPDSQCHNVVADYTSYLECEVYFKQEAKQCKLHDQYHKQSSYQQKSRCNNRRFSIPFSEFLNKVICLLDRDCGDKLEFCKGFCCTLDHSDDHNEPLFNDKDVKKINKCKNFKDLFNSPLRYHYGWNQLDIVEAIIRMSELDEAEVELKRYNQLISSNKEIEILSDFVSEDELPSQAIKVSVIQESSRPPSKNLTVEKYQEARNAILYETLKVKPYTPYPHVLVNYGSLHLHWYVPEHAAEHMKKIAKMNESLLMKQSVVFIKIDDDVIFDHRPLNQQPGAEQTIRVSDHSQLSSKSYVSRAIREGYVQLITENVPTTRYLKAKCGIIDGWPARLECYKDVKSANEEKSMMWSIHFTDVDYVSYIERRQRGVVKIGLQKGNEVPFYAYSDNSTMKWYNYCALLFKIPKYAIPRENVALQQEEFYINDFHDAGNVWVVYILNKGVGCIKRIHGFCNLYICNSSSTFNVYDLHNGKHLLCWNRDDIGLSGCINSLVFVEIKETRHGEHAGLLWMQEPTQQSAALQQQIHKFLYACPKKTQDTFSSALCFR